MTGRNRLSFMTVIALIVLVLNAVWTVPALADDSAPPPADPPTETAAPPEVEPAVSDLPAPVDEPTPLPEVMDQLPEGTEVIVTDAAGEALPLATQAAQETIANNDPMWCPAGVTPGGAGCSPSFSLFGAVGGDDTTELLAWLGTHEPTKAGTIWIEGGYDSGTAEPATTGFTVDGGVLTTMANFALTLQGGWIGVGKTVDQSNPSEFNASFTILDWNAPITLNDFIVTGATVNPNAGTTAALHIETTKSITVNRVQSSDNSLDGATLANGMILTGTLAPVIVNDSVFNHNTGLGLQVYSEGNITIHNLTADFNGQDNGAPLEYGAFITNFSTPSAPRPITFTGTNEFKGNLGLGLYTTSYGVVTLNNITAFANDDLTDGDAGDGGGVMIDSSLMVKITGTNSFSNNQLNGLSIVSEGNVTMSNVTASNNGQNGVLLDNCLNSGANTPCTTVARSLTVTGTNIFDGNGSDGLSVRTSGAIKLSQITATDNGIEGARLDNCASSSPSATICTTPLPYAVTLTAPGTFLNNTFDGLYILTTGAVSLKGITSSFNQFRGVYIDNRGSLLKPQNVTLSGMNVINGNENIGLRIMSYGSVAASNVTANDNGIVDACALCFGMLVDNMDRNGATLESFLVTRKPVTLTGTNTFNNNYNGGLSVYTVGAVTLSNLTAVGTLSNVGSVGDGVYVYNNWDWVPSGVTLTPPTPFTANVTLTGYGVFQGNADEGLQIITHGAVKLNNVTSNDNNGYGLYVDNTYFNAGLSGSVLASRQPVTLAGTNTFNGNLGSGLYVYSMGAISINNLTAIDNDSTGSGGLGHGVNLINAWDWYPASGPLTAYAANVTLSGFGYFDDNKLDGLRIFSRGAVTLKNTTANNNGDTGVYISTIGDLLPQNVTLNGVNSFSGNGFGTTTGDGLFVQNDGKITISGLSAVGNQVNGAYLDNFTFKKAGKFLGVTLTGVSTFQNNQTGDGLYIHTDGSVILSHVQADDNGGDGLDVTATKNITLTCGTAFSNTGTGFLLNSGAILTLKGVHAYYNGTDETLTGSLVRTLFCP